MPYASAQDISDRYGADKLLLLADRNADDAADTEVVDQALRDASAEIDTYLAAKYSMPLPSVPDALVRLCVDIAVYRLGVSADLATEEMRQRYEDAVALLGRISKGTASLGLPKPPSSSNGAVLVAGPKRRFGRDNLL